MDIVPVLTIVKKYRNDRIIIQNSCIVNEKRYTIIGPKYNNQFFWNLLPPH